MDTRPVACGGQHGCRRGADDQFQRSDRDRISKVRAFDVKMRDAIITSGHRDFQARLPMTRNDDLFWCISCTSARWIEKLAKKGRAWAKPMQPALDLIRGRTGLAGEGLAAPPADLAPEKICSRSAASLRARGAATTAVRLPSTSDGLPSSAFVRPLHIRPNHRGRVPTAPAPVRRATVRDRGSAASA